MAEPAQVCLTREGHPTLATFNPRNTTGTLQPPHQVPCRYTGRITCFGERVQGPECTHVVIWQAIIIIVPFDEHGFDQWLRDEHLLPACCRLAQGSIDVSLPLTGMDALCAQDWKLLGKKRIDEDAILAIILRERSAFVHVDRTSYYPHDECVPNDEDNA